MGDLSPLHDAARTVIILGIRGIPAAHGGFETFAERLAIWLRDRGWRVIVYCQGSASGQIEHDSWEDIERVHIPVTRSGVAATMEFDLKATRHALNVNGTILTLGYNTGALGLLVRGKGRRNIVNMDGIEWKRAKYGLGPKAYLWINERLAGWSATTLIADHPVIADHLSHIVPRSKISTIAYGADDTRGADLSPLSALGLQPDRFFTVIARPEPENGILEIVRAMKMVGPDATLALLGNYDRSHPYQARVLEEAGDNVKFVGAIYDKQALASLRAGSRAYIHGHRVGGTNPSLVEALGAGRPIIANDNAFNRWVADDSALYFTDTDSCALAITQMLQDDQQVDRLAAAAHRRWSEAFTWPIILTAYERLLAADATPLS